MLSAFTLVAVLGSYHFDEDFDAEWFNPGIGVEAPITHRAYFGSGIYHNSYGDTTTYLGVGTSVFDIENFTFGLEAAKAWGYEDYPYIGGISISHAVSGFKLLINHKIVALQYKF